MATCVANNPSLNSLPMPPSPPPLDQLLISLIDHYLLVFNYSNALFYAERLYYQNPHPSEHLFLLSKCYYLQGKYKQVYHLLKSSSISSHNHSSTSLPNRYLFAMVCYQLKKYSECEDSLIPYYDFNPMAMTSDDVNLIPGGTNGLYLLGLICRKEQRKKYAQIYFEKCLELDNTCWSAFNELCEMGIHLNLDKIYSISLNNASQLLQTFTSQDSSYPSSSSSSAAWKGKLNSKLNSKKQPVEKINSQPTLMEKRKSVEKIRDYRSSPAAATSLGLSSCAVRIGFATPGGMPSPSMASLSMGQMSMLSNSHINYPNPAYTMPINTAMNTNTSLGQDSHLGSDRTPLQVSSNPLQYLLQSRYRSQLHDIEEMKSNDQIFSSHMTPTPQVTKHLFPLTNDQTMINTIGNQTNEMRRSVKGQQLFDTPDIVDKEDKVKSERGERDEEEEEDYERQRNEFEIGREIHFRGMDTPGLTPIERGVRGEECDHDGIIGPVPDEDNGLLYSLNTEKRGEKSDFTLGEEDISIDLRQNPLARDEVRRRVSFEPMLGDQLEETLIGEGDDSDMLGDGSGYHPHKIPRRQRGDASRSVSPPESNLITHHLATQPPVMRGRKKSVEREKDTPTSSRYLPNTSTHSASNSIQRGTSSSLRSVQQRSLSPQPSAPRGGSHSSPPPHQDSLGTHSYAPPARTNHSPARRVNNKSPSRSSSPPVPVPVGTKTTKTRSTTNISPPRTTPRTMPRTPTSTSKTIGGGAAGGGTRIQKDRTSLRSKLPVEEPVIEESPQKTEQIHIHTEISSFEQSEKYIVSLVVVCSHIKFLLSQYQCNECISVCQLLPRNHFSSGWVQQMIGRAYFELNDYKSSQFAFREMLRLEPFRVNGTELLSTCLWHLKKEQELCALAQQVVEIDKFSPESWCVVGNSFSLRREHETAVKFFERALQIDRSFAYAHTLCGHEYVCNEDLEKAIQSFREAIYHDDRHYNAWYGLGTIYYRQERFELSEYHFKRAIEINTNSSVLRCHLGLVLNAHNRSEKTLESLELLRKACSKDTKNPQLHFQYAHVLFTNGSYNCLVEALSALQIVKEYAPKEPPVFALLGQVCHRLGKNQEALRHFNCAIELDPKQASLLKPTLDLIQDPYLASASEEIQSLIGDM